MKPFPPEPLPPASSSDIKSESDVILAGHIPKRGRRWVSLALVATLSLARFSRAANPAPSGPDFPLFMYEAGSAPAASNFVPYGWNILQDYSASSTSTINSFLQSCGAIGENGPAAIPSGAGTAGSRTEMTSAQSQSWIQSVSGNANLAWWNMPEEVETWVPSEMQMLGDYCAWTRQNDPQARPNYEVVESSAGAGVFAQLSAPDVLGFEAYPEYANQPHAWVRYAVQDAMIAGILQSGRTIGTNYQAGQKLPVCVLGIAKSGTAMPTPAQSYHDFWSAIASGARGIGVFAYWHAIYDDPSLAACLAQVNTAASQMTGTEHLGDVILNGTVDPNVSFSIFSGPTQTVAFTPSGRSAPVSYPSLNVRSIVRAGNVYVIAVNSTDQPVTASINNLATAAASATVLFQSRSVVLSSGALTDTFPAWGVNIYKMPLNTGAAAAAPARLMATAVSNSQISLSWATTAGATSYNVKRATSSGGPYSVVATGLTQGVYTDFGLTNQAVYYYVVSALNDYGESPNSLEASAMTQPYNGTWTNASLASWNNSANWSGGVVATGTGETADFSTLNLTADATVTLDAARTIGNLIFGDTTPSNNWILSTGTCGPLTLNVSLGTPTITVNNQTVTINAVLAGSEGFVKAGAGTLALTAANLYSGMTTVSAGTLSVAGDQSNATGGWLINGGAAANFQTSSHILVASGQSVTLQNNNTAHTLNVAGTVTNAGALLIQAGGNLNINSGANWMQGGSLTLQPNTAYTNAQLTVNTGGSFTYTGTSIISLSASAGGDSGSATLNIGGGTFITGNGFHNATSTGTGAANLQLSNGGTLRLLASIPTLAATAGRPFNVQVGTGGGIVDTGGFSTAITQGIVNISGQTGSLTKQGLGTLTLSGPSTHTGATTVANGGLVVTGTLGASAVTIQNGATLDGTGSLSGPVTVQAGGILTSGAGGIGTLTINNSVILAGTTQLGISQSGSTLSADNLAVATSVAYGGTLIVTNVGPDALTPGSVFQLFSAGSYSGSFSTISLPTLSTGFVWDTSSLATNGTIAVRDIPVAVADSGVTGQNGATSIAVLTGDSDPSGSTISIQSVTQGMHGTVAISGKNVTYTPAANWSGTDTFTYTIANTWGGTATATVTVTVAPPPTFTVNTISKPNATQGSAYSDTIAGAATDSYAGDTFTYAKVGGPAWLSIAANGALSGTPASTDVGSNSWTVQVTDNFGSTANATLNIFVKGVLPAGMTSMDIGSVGMPGSGGQSGGVYTVNGSGADIWGSADAFHFVSEALTGDGEIRARVVSQTNTNSWAKAGVMLRATSDPGSANAVVEITPGNGFVFQYRATAGGTSVSIYGPALNAAPNNWVRLTRSGTLITAYVSADGNTWAQIGTAVISMASSIDAGLAVTSHDNTQTSTATFDNLTVTPFPAPWQSVDIGTPGMQGSAECFNSIFTMKGAGNLSGTADNFRFVYQTMSGDGEIRARIPAPGSTGTGARLGVMIRNDLTPVGMYAFMGIDETSTYTWQRRMATGGNKYSTTSGSGTAPSIWVRVVRTGGKLYGYKSTDGISWTVVNSFSISMGTTTYVGLVVASGSTTTLNTTVFDNITVVP